MKFNFTLTLDGRLVVRERKPQCQNGILMGGAHNADIRLTVKHKDVRGTVLVD